MAARRQQRHRGRPRLAGQYRDKGVNMLPERAQFVTDTMDEDTKAVKTSVEAGIQSILTAFTEGRLKISTPAPGSSAKSAGIAATRERSSKPMMIGDAPVTCG